MRYSLFVLLWCSRCEYLTEALSTNVIKKKPIRRVAIIGAGISGLAMAHALQSPLLQQDYGSGSCDFEQVAVFESRPRLDASVGAGIQLNGGLAVLEQVSPGLRQAVAAAGLSMTTVRSTCRPWQESQQDYDTLLELDLKKTVQESPAADSLIIDDELQWTCITRGALQETLYNNLPSSTKVEFNKLLIQLECSNDELYCCFQDGSKVGPFDIVIGCDGIKSAVKEFVSTGKIPKQAADRDGAATAAIYSGIRIRYAVWEQEQQQADATTRATLTQYFGNGAYALNGIYGTGANKPLTKSAFVVYLDDDYIGPIQRTRENGKVKVGENADWSQNVQTTKSQGRQDTLQLLERAGIPTTDLGPIISNADRFFELGVYFHNPFQPWFRQVTTSRTSDSLSPFVVVCGDAAHALPPFLGQGSNQAIQDAYCLATKLHRYNQVCSSPQSSESGEDLPADPTLKELLQEYEKTRWPVVFGIFWKSLFLGYLETGGVDGFYSKFRDVFFKTMGVIGVAKQVLLSAATPRV